MVLKSSFIGQWNYIKLDTYLLYANIYGTELTVERSSAGAIEQVLGHLPKSVQYRLICFMLS